MAAGGVNRLALGGGACAVERAANPLHSARIDTKSLRYLCTPSARPGAFRAARICASRSGAIRGRPSLLPSALARLRPARTRSWMIERSNSAKTPSIWNMALPPGDVVSMPC